MPHGRRLELIREWDRVAEESNRNGQILAGVERKYMVATDYSPMK